MPRLPHYVNYSLIVLFTFSGCASGKMWGFAKREKSGSQKQLEQNQNEAIMASIEDQSVPRKFDELKDPLSLQIAYAKWQEQVGQHKEAKLTYEKALEKNPNSVEAQIGLARIEQLAERYPLAERAYKKALSMDPQSPVAMLALANFYISQDRQTEALPLLAKAVDVDPINKNYRYEYAIALTNAGKPDLAISHMTYAVGESEALYNIGYLMQQNGNKTDGENYMKLALAKNPQLEQAKQFLHDQTTPNPPQTLLTSYRVPITEQKVTGEQLAQDPSQTPTIVPSNQPAHVTTSPASDAQSTSPNSGWKRDVTPQQMEQLRNQSF
jgi:tetratricopeptide (TPR) repeat protein